MTRLLITLLVFTLATAPVTADNHGRTLLSVRRTQERRRELSVDDFFKKIGESGAELADAFKKAWEDGATKLKDGIDSGLAKHKNNTEDFMGAIKSSFAGLKDLPEDTLDTSMAGWEQRKADWDETVKDLATKFAETAKDFQNCSEIWDVVADIGQVRDHGDVDALVVTGLEANKACWGDVSAWGREKGKQLGGLLPALNSSDIQKMAGDAVKGAIEAAKDLDQIADEKAGAIVDRIKRSDVYGKVKDWTAKVVGEIGDLMKKVNVTDIKELVDDALEACADKLQPEQLAGLGERLRDSASGMVKKIMDKVNASALKESVGDLGKVENWAKQQAKDVVTKLKDPKVLGVVKDWTKETLDKVGGLVGGLDLDDIKAVTHTAFKGAVGNFGKLTNWTKDEARELADKSKLAVGGVAIWTQGNFDDAAGFLGGLSSSDWPKMDVNFVMHVNDSSFELIDWTADPNNFKAFVKKVGELAKVGAGKAQCLLKGAKKAFGEAQQWSKDAMDMMGALISRVNVTDLRTVGMDSLAKSKAVTKLTADQLKALADKIVDMIPTQLMEFLAKITDPDNLKAAFASFANATERAVDRAKGEGAVVRAKGEVALAHLKEASAALWAKAKEVSGPVSQWNADKLKEAKALLASIDVDEIKALANDRFRAALETFGKVTTWTEEQLAALKEKMVAAHGAVATWTQDTVKKAGTILAALAESEANAIAAGKLRAAVDKTSDLLEKATVGADAFWKRVRESEAYGKVRAMSSDAIKQLKGAAEVLGDQVKDLSASAFDGAVESLAKAGDWSDAQFAALGDKALEVWGGTKGWTAQQGKQLGDLIRGLNATEITQCAGAAAKGAVKAARRLGGLTKDQAKALADKIKESDAYGAVATWSKATVDELGDFARDALSGAGAGAGSIPDIAKDTFKQAANGLQKLDGWTKAQLAAFGEKAKEAYPRAKEWTGQTVENLGKFVAGLGPDWLGQISFEASIKIIPGAVDKMNKTQTKAFPPHVLGNMTAATKLRFNGKKLTEMTPKQVRSCVCDPDAATTATCPRWIVDTELSVPANGTISGVRAWVAGLMGKKGIAATDQVTVLTVDYTGGVGATAASGSTASGRLRVRRRLLSGTTTAEGFQKVVVRTEFDSSTEAAAGASAASTGAASSDGATVTTSTTVSTTGESPAKTPVAPGGGVANAATTATSGAHGQAHMATDSLTSAAVLAVVVATMAAQAA